MSSDVTAAGAAGAGQEALALALAAVAEGLELHATVSVADGPEGSLVATFEGEDLQLLIGRDGQTIDAVQYLAAQVVSRAEGGSRRRVVVDADGYRVRRAAKLEALAKRAADEAVTHGDEIELDAMSPQDRRIIHLTLQDHPGVVTRSEGQEPNRRVIVEPSEIFSG